MTRIFIILIAGILACSHAMAEPVRNKDGTDHVSASGVPDQLRQAVLRSFCDRSSSDGVLHGEYAIAQIGTTDHYVVYARAPGRCGSGGCVPSIWVKEGETYRPKQSLTVSHLPIVQLPELDHGMPRLGISVFDKNRVRMVILPVHFDGAEYSRTSRELPDYSGFALVSREMLQAFLQEPCSSADQTKNSKGQQSS